MITVGDIYILSKEAESLNILYDLFEMCKGCQHPTRGLFIRYYLSLISKGKLPDNGGDYETEKYTVKDSVRFIIDNFNEMVHLFVRLRIESKDEEKEQIEKDRKELAGKNITIYFL